MLLIESGATQKMAGVPDKKALATLDNDWLKQVN